MVFNNHSTYAPTGSTKVWNSEPCSDTKKERPKTTPGPLYSSLIKRLLRLADRLSKYTTWPTTLIYIRTHYLLTLPSFKWRAHNIDARSLYWISTNTASVHKNQQNWIPQIKKFIVQWFAKFSTTQAPSVLMIIRNRVVPTWLDTGAADETQWSAKLSITKKQNSRFMFFHTAKTSTTLSIHHQTKLSLSSPLDLL
jgi:hypothetical protein